MKEKIEKLKEDLVKMGFVRIPNLIQDSYDIDISWFKDQYKVLSVSVDPGNQYVYVREGNDSYRAHDSIVCLFNGDISGELTFDHIRLFHYALTLRKKKKEE